MMIFQNQRQFFIYALGTRRGNYCLSVVGLVPLGSIHVVWCIQMAAETGSAIALLVVGVLLSHRWVGYTE